MFKVLKNAAPNAKRELAKANRVYRDNNGPGKQIVWRSETI